MGRRSRAGGEPAKSPRGKHAALKQRNAPKSGVRQIPAARQETEVVRFTRELNEAREQQTATAEILASITGSIHDATIIAVTSYALSGEGKNARAAGCDDYVPKLFSPRQLLAKIRRYLQ